MFDLSTEKFIDDSIGQVTRKTSIEEELALIEQSKPGGSILRQHKEEKVNPFELGFDTLDHDNSPNVDTDKLMVAQRKSPKVENVVNFMQGSASASKIKYDESIDLSKSSDYLC